MEIFIKLNALDGLLNEIKEEVFEYDIWKMH